MATQRLKITNTTRQMVTLLLPLEHGAHRLPFEKSVLDRVTGETTINRSTLKLPTSLSLTPKGMDGSSIEDLPTELATAPDIVAAAKKGTIKVESYEPKTNETGDPLPADPNASSDDKPAGGDKPAEDGKPEGDAPKTDGEILPQLPAASTSDQTATGGDSATQAGVSVPNASPASPAGDTSTLADKSADPTTKTASKRGARE